MATTRRECLRLGAPRFLSGSTEIKKLVRSHGLVAIKLIEFAQCTEYMGRIPPEHRALLSIPIWAKSRANF